MPSSGGGLSSPAFRIHRRGRWFSRRDLQHCAPVWRTSSVHRGTQRSSSRPESGGEGGNRGRRFFLSTLMSAFTAIPFPVWFRDFRLIRVSRRSSDHTTILPTSRMCCRCTAISCIAMFTKTVGRRPPRFGVGAERSAETCFSHSAGSTRDTGARQSRILNLGTGYIRLDIRGFWGFDSKRQHFLTR